MFAIPASRALTFGGGVKAGFIGGVAAALINLVWFLILKAYGVSLVFAMGPGAAPAPLPFYLVLIASLVPLLVAGLAFGLATRWARNPVRTYRTVAGVLALFSLVGPATTGAGGSTIFGLVVMHLVAGAFALLLPRWA